MRRSSLYTRSVKCIHLSVVRFRHTGFTGMKSCHGFQEVGPWKRKMVVKSQIPGTKTLFFSFLELEHLKFHYKDVSCALLLSHEKFYAMPVLLWGYSKSIICSAIKASPLRSAEKKTRTNKNHVNSQLQSFRVLCPVLTSWEKKILEGTGKVKSRTWGRKQVSSITIYKINIGQISRFNSRVWYLLS